MGACTSRGAFFAMVVLATSGMGISLSAQLDFPPPVSAEVPLPPAPLSAMGHTYLIYELHVRNFAPMEVTLKRVEAFVGDSRDSAVRYEGEALASNLLRAGGQDVEAGVLPPGGFDVVYMWMELDGAAQPSSLRHRLTLDISGEPAAVETRVGVRSAGEVPVLGPPLRGGPWVTGHGPTNTSGHRRIIVPLEGRPVVPQRFAIDYFKIDQEGKVFSGDERDRTHHYAYGEEVLAVADALVVAAHDGIPDNEGPEEAFVRYPAHAPLALMTRAVPISLETVAGNYVILELRPGWYAFYAHFKPESLRVRVGDRVRKGQVLGLLGLSGNTPTPHLHFGLVDENATLANEGLPYVFDEFEWVGECPAGPEPWSWYQTCTFGDPSPRSGEIPLGWQLVRFPG